MTKTNFSDYSNKEAQTQDKDTNSMGYSHNGEFYIGDAVVREHLNITILAPRRFKEYEVDEVRYTVPLKTRKNTLPQGVKPQEKNQFMVVINHDVVGLQLDKDGNETDKEVTIESGSVFNFGCNAYNLKSFWYNPSGGQWKNKNYELGLMGQFDAFIRDLEEEHGASDLPYYIFSFTIYPDPKQVTVKNFTDPSKKSKVRLLRSDYDFEFVGDEQAEKNVNLFNDLNVIDWMNEHNVASSEATASTTSSEAYTEDDDDEF